LALLARAFVKRPPLVILDEPYQGLDPATRTQAKEWVARQLTAEQTLLVVSHDPADLPATLHGILEMSIASGDDRTTKHTKYTKEMRRDASKN
jgi:molybdate transport system ATP-binding protein